MMNVNTRNCRSGLSVFFRPVCALLVFAVTAAVNESQLRAQSDAPSQPAAAENGGAPVSEPPETRPSGDPAPQPKQSPSDPVAEKKRPGLPSDYTPPAQLSPEASSDEEWIVTIGDGTKRAVDRARSKYNRIRNEGRFSEPGDREDFVKYLQWKLSQLTLRENLLVRKNHEKLRKFKQEVLTDVRKAGSNNRQFRDTMLELIVQETPNLFKYHHLSRLSGAVILSELNAQREPRTPYLPAARPLLDLFKQKHQAPGVRIAAARGLRRMVEQGQAPDELAEEIIDAFVDELQTGNKQQKHLRTALVSHLGHFRRLNDSQGKPAVPFALTQVLADEDESLRTRSEAAAALGRLPLDNAFNIELICYEIVKLGHEVAEAFQQDSMQAVNAGQQPNHVRWSWTFAGLYIAFKGDSKSSVSHGDGLSRKTFKPAFNNTVRDAYNQILPLVQKNLRTEKIDPAQLNQIKQWLQTNLPANKKVNDAFPEIKTGDDPPKIGAKTNGNAPASQ